MTKENNLLYLRSVGSGSDPSVTPPLAARGLIATDVITLQELFTIPVAHAFLSSSRQYFYNVLEKKIEVFDGHTGKQVGNIILSHSLKAGLNGRRIIKQYTSHDERLLYQISGITEYPLLLQLVDLKSGNVLKSTPISDPSCNTIVAFVQNAKDAIYLRCKELVHRLDIITQQIMPLSISSHSLIAIAPNGHLLYSLANGVVSIHDIKTGTILEFLPLTLNTSPGYYKLLISNDGLRLFAIAKTYEKSGSEQEIRLKQVGTYVEIFDLKSKKQLSRIEWLFDFLSFEINQDGTVIYGISLECSEYSANSKLTSYDAIMGSVLSQHIYFDEIITELILV